MSVEKKTLKIDPNLFSFSNNTTRKKRAPGEPGKIKIKGESQKKKDATLKKKSILKMIRQHQEDRYKKMFEKNGSTSPAISQSADESGSFKKEFQEAKEFMENLTEKKQAETSMKNFTLKHRPAYESGNHSMNSILMGPGPALIPVEPILPTIRNVANAQVFQQAITNNPMQLAPPKFGCLKNGALPTYRNFMNTTQKRYPELGPGQGQAQGPLQAQGVASSFMMDGGNKPNNELSQEHAMVEKRINDGLNRVNTMQQTVDKMRELRQKSRPKIKKRKRTLRRTYKIGKSKVFPRVSVLVSNKTLRNNISTKTQLLKQTPITEVKKFLIKRGFIKVGSTAPNDILRKMYESATLICGEVQNHNPDNLLYNFLNSEE